MIAMQPGEHIAIESEKVLTEHIDHEGYQKPNLASTTDADEKEIRDLRWKQDLIMIPLMACSIGILLLDKTALGSSATLTLQKDLHLHGTQYSWAVSIYYFGLFTGTYPANWLLQRYHSGRVVGIACCIWGCVMIGTMGVNDFRSLAACRFLLGLFESALLPGFTSIISRFWVPREQPLRFAFLNLGNTIAPIPFLAIFFAIGHAKTSIAPWRFIFLLLGGLTLIDGVLLLLIMPDRPDTCKWFTERQKTIAVERLNREQVSAKDTTFKREQFIEAITDPRAWIIGMMFFCQQSATVIAASFSGLIIKGFGYTGLSAMILQIPGWACASVAILTVGWAVTQFNVLRSNKTLLAMLVNCCTLMCAIVIKELPPNHGGSKALGLTLISIINFNNTTYNIILSLVGQNFAGTTKKQTVMVITFSFYCLSNICIPQAFLQRQAPYYQNGLITVATCQGLFFVLNGTFWLITRRENKRRDSMAVHDSAYSQGTEADPLECEGDSTDKQNKHFRYLG